MNKSVIPSLATLLVVASQLLQAADASEKKDDIPAVLLPTDSVADHSGYLTFFLDNDLFNGTDSNYTNGARISYITEAKPVINIPFIQKNLEGFSGGADGHGWSQKIWGFKDPNEVEFSYGFALTQLMFTPTTRDTLTPPPGEHPYAGWLGLGLSLHARDARTLNSVEITIGMVGPNSLAQKSQDLIHDFRDIDKFLGWDSQIPNEVTLNVAFNQRRRWTLLDEAALPFDLEIDGFHETGYALGNYLTAVRLGGIIRFGWNLPIELSDPRLTTLAHTQKLYSDKGGNDSSWSFYGLIGARASGIVHDITLDGPVFRNFETGVKRQPWVGEVYAGFGARYKRWEFGYVHTYRTRRFETQADPQAFGSVAFRTRF